MSCSIFIVPSRLSSPSSSSLSFFSHSGKSYVAIPNNDNAVIDAAPALSNSTLHIVVSATAPYRSWFVGQTVQSNGNLFFLLPIDSLFLAFSLLLPLNRAERFSELLADTSAISLLNDACIAHSNVFDITDLGDGEDKFFKYNAPKAREYCLNKLYRIREHSFLTSHVSPYINVKTGDFSTASVLFIWKDMLPKVLFDELMEECKVEFGIFNAKGCLVETSLSNLQQISVKNQVNTKKRKIVTEKERGQTSLWSFFGK